MLDRPLRYEQILLQLYDAALLPERWRDALLGIARYTGADGFHFFALEIPSGVPNFGLVSHDFWHGAMIEYAQYYGQIDPRRQVVQRLLPGELFVCHHHIDARFADHDEYYQDFLRKYDSRYALGGSLSRTETSEVFFALMRGRTRGAYTEIETSRARAGRWLVHGRLFAVLLGLRRGNKHASRAG